MSSSYKELEQGRENFFQRFTVKLPLLFKNELATNVAILDLGPACNLLGPTDTGFYRPQWSCGKVMYLHMTVILSTGGGVCLPHTPGQTPPGQTPLGQTPPGRHSPWADPFYKPLSTEKEIS